MTSRRAFLRSLLSTSALIAGGLSLTHIVPAETREAVTPGLSEENVRRLIEEIRLMTDAAERRISIAPRYLYVHPKDLMAARAMIDARTEIRLLDAPAA